MKAYSLISWALLFTSGKSRLIPSKYIKGNIEQPHEASHARTFQDQQKQQLHQQQSNEHLVNNTQVKAHKPKPRHYGGDHSFPETIDFQKQTTQEQHKYNSTIKSKTNNEHTPIPRHYGSHHTYRNHLDNSHSSIENMETGKKGQPDSMKFADTTPAFDDGDHTKPIDHVMDWNTDIKGCAETGIMDPKSCKKHPLCAHQQMAFYSIEGEGSECKCGGFLVCSSASSIGLYTSILSMLSYSIFVFVL